MATDTIWGYNESADRIRNDTMRPSQRVALDHDFYTNNYEAAQRKNKEVEDSRRDDLGYSAGYKYDVPKKRGENAKAENFAVRSKHAIGGSAKVRLYAEGHKSKSK